MEGPKDLGNTLGTFMMSRPTSGFSHWLEFVYTECRQEATMTLRGFSRRRIFSYVFIMTRKSTHDLCHVKKVCKNRY